MNNVAILPKTIMYLLQNQNVKREVAKKVQVTSSSVIAESIPQAVITSPTISTGEDKTSEKMLQPAQVDGTPISQLETNN